MSEFASQPRSCHHNPKAKNAITRFFEREDTISLGVCNGCQLFIELGLINKDHSDKPKMKHNDSNKFEFRISYNRDFPSYLGKFSICSTRPVSPCFSYNITVNS